MSDSSLWTDLSCAHRIAVRVPVSGITTNERTPKQLHCGDELLMIEDDWDLLPIYETKVRSGVRFDSPTLLGDVLKPRRGILNRPVA
jgi:hypothetical protein